MIHEQVMVAVVVERRVSTSKWGDETKWSAAAVLPGVPDVAPWTSLGARGEVTRYFAGAATIELYSTDTAQYRDNLSSGAPKLWIVVRAFGPEPPVEIAMVTADPAEGEAATEMGASSVEQVDMPSEVAALIAAFVEAHHIDRPFIKRQRRPGPKGGDGARPPAPPPKSKS